MSFQRSEPPTKPSVPLSQTLAPMPLRAILRRTPNQRTKGDVCSIWLSPAHLNAAHGLRFTAVEKLGWAV